MGIPRPTFDKVVPPTVRTGLYPRSWTQPRHRRVLPSGRQQGGGKLTNEQARVGGAFAYGGTTNGIFPFQVASAPANPARAAAVTAIHCSSVVLPKPARRAAVRTPGAGYRLLDPHPAIATAVANGEVVSGTRQSDHRPGQISRGPRRMGPHWRTSNRRPPRVEQERRVRPTMSRSPLIVFYGRSQASR
jgi:hypothetical protein